MALKVDVLKRYFSNKYSRKDYLFIREHLQNRWDDQELKNLIQTHWEEFGTEILPEGEINFILHKMHHQIHLEENRESRKMNYRRLFQKAAAIIILPLIFSFFIYMLYQSGERISEKAFAEIQCPMGVRTKFQLPDGTSGFLNSGSTLRYPMKFNKSRKVSVSGEAFFDVAKNDKIPFIVETQMMNIKVLGTSFNVIAYPDEKFEEVILLKGSLDILGKRGNKLGSLSPDQKMVVASETGTGIKSDITASQYTLWKEGKLVFRNEDMTQVARRLSRWYNAEIIVADPRLYHYTFYATFQDEQLDEVLKLLALTTPIMYEEVKRELSSDGLYVKRKIILKVNPKKIKEFN